ncbi:MAG: preprotein translocase subunit SecE [Coriobacteriia bacterium]|nr:preprotein translocase subunit SecE [Coriobacteriia bacterium]
MAKDKKKNDAAKKTAPKKEQPKKQDAKAGKDTGKKADKNTKKGGPVAEQNPNIISKLFTYLSEVRAELKRVTWPTREKVIYLVGVVIVTLIFFAFFTASVDWASSEGIVALNSLTETEREPVNNEVPVEIDLDSLGLGEGGVVGDEGVAEEESTDADIDGAYDVDTDADVDAAADTDADETEE